MLKSDIRHQLWLTRKTFQRKLGGKEDDCVVASDSELDAKIELFKAIQTEGNTLHRTVDQYQERICIMAQEENSLGKFLKENGKFSQTTDKVMISCGKAISYCGQMRFLIRPPLLRFFNEIEVFRRRAITDTENTITLMEKQRTEYRASLSWMKSVSNMLDPDSDRMLEKFRNAQGQVRQTKEKFDKYSLDCLQKIDLLAASRCNMFSHVLITYMENLQQFFVKSIDTLKILSSTLALESNCGFDIAKNRSKKKHLYDLENFIGALDLESNKCENILDDESSNNDILQDNTDTLNSQSIPFNLVDISDESTVDKNLESGNQLMSNTKFSFIVNSESFIVDSLSMDVNKQNILQDVQHSVSNWTKCATHQTNDRLSENNKTHSWFDLFSELDPFADPDDMTRQFGGKVADTQAA